MKALTKTYTKTNTVKTKDGYITFEAYKTLILGKKYIAYFGDIDIIIDVFKDNLGLINYRVKEEKSGIERIHGTFLNPAKVF